LHILLLGWADLATSRDVVKVLTLASTKTIVRLSIVVLLEVGLDPLAELQVVLVLGF